MSSALLLKLFTGVDAGTCAGTGADPGVDPDTAGNIEQCPASAPPHRSRPASQTKVTDAAGNDITGAKPSYKVQEGAWGAPEEDEPDVDPTDWVDKSVTGFKKADTSWLQEAVPEVAQQMDERARKKAEQDVSPKSNKFCFCDGPPHAFLPGPSSAFTGDGAAYGCRGLRTGIGVAKL